MAVNNNSNIMCESEERVKKLYEKFLILNQELIRCGVNVEDLREVCEKRGKPGKSRKKEAVFTPAVIVTMTLVTVVCLSILLKVPVIETILKRILGTRCLLPNTYVIWEATRPETDCNTCKNVTEVLVFENITRETFSEHAYSPRPMLMKGAALHWPAMQSFSYNFLKEIYENTDGAYQSVEDECQILTFKTEFKSLEDVFHMSESRVRQEEGEKPWYVGWSNCHPDILAIIRDHYETPHFLPKDAEHARTDYIFIGYEQGAVMHLDYISRLMWQAQIQGHKTWQLVPPPDCEHICTSMSFHVDPGDIVLLDTRQWYHDTCIDPGELSLTVSSEYG